MTQDFEYMSYAEADRIAMLESRAAELERRLAEAVPPGALSGGLPWPGHAAEDGGTGEFRRPRPHPRPGGGARGRDRRTEALISRGRPRAARARWVRSHWRPAGLGLAVFLVGVLVLSLVLGGRGASWPSSVARVQGEITVACRNPDTAAEPSQVNFACAKDTQAVLWVFSLLTSGDDPGYADRATGRAGLEPITAAQGGDIAWSLNLHHPYDPGSPVDSLMVAARAVDNIIGGATLTSAAGAPVVQPGLESRAADCRRYTGSPRLAARAGYPARCALPVVSAAGQAALVADVFRQWTGGGVPAAVAAQAGILFADRGDPGNPRVQAILAGLGQ